MIELRLVQEYGISYQPARVLVFEDDVLVGEVIAFVEHKKGADGGMFPCVTLKCLYQKESRCRLSE